MTTAAPTLRILGRHSSINVRKVCWTCQEIGIPFEREDWGRGFASPTSPEFLALNPNGLIPVVETPDGLLWESNTICRYLAHAHGREDLLPSDPWRRARIEKWMDWQSAELNAAWRYAFHALSRGTPGHSDQARIEASVTEWTAKMGVLDHALSRTGSYIDGDVFSLADVVVGLSVNRWLMTPMRKPNYPFVTAYHDRLGGRRGFVENGYKSIP